MDMSIADKSRETIDALGQELLEITAKARNTRDTSRMLRKRCSA